MVVGISHVKTPIAVREKWAQNIDKIQMAVEACYMSGAVSEYVIVATCNRIEIYMASVSVGITKQRMLEAFAHAIGMTQSESVDVGVYTYVGQRAVKHAMRVASGLDSIVMGETQILGQMRNAYLLAKDAGMVGTWLDRMFQAVLHVSKRVHAELRLNDGALSIPYAAAGYAKEWVENRLNAKATALVLGAGEMGSLVAQHLVSQGFTHVYVSNRTDTRAQDVAETVGAIFLPWSDVSASLPDVNVVVTCTSSLTPILLPRDIETWLAHRSQKHVLLLDLGLPRNVDMSVSAVHRDIQLVDIDHFKQLVQANEHRRQIQSLSVENLIEEAWSNLNHWMESKKIAPLLRAMREKGSRIQEGVMQSLRNKLSDLDPQEHDLISTLTMSIVNQLLRDPTLFLKQNVERMNDDEIDMFARFLGLNSSVNLGDAQASLSTTSTDLRTCDIRTFTAKQRELA